LKDYFKVRNYFDRRSARSKTSLIFQLFITTDYTTKTTIIPFF